LSGRHQTAAQTKAKKIEKGVTKRAQWRLLRGAHNTFLYEHDKQTTYEYFTPHPYYEEEAS